MTFPDKMTVTPTTRPVHPLLAALLAVATPEQQAAAQAAWDAAGRPFHPEQPPVPVMIQRNLLALAGEFKAVDEAIHPTPSGESYLSHYDAPVIEAFAKIDMQEAVDVMQQAAQCVVLLAAELEQERQHRKDMAESACQLQRLHQQVLTANHSMKQELLAAREASGDWMARAEAADANVGALAEQLKAAETKAAELQAEVDRVSGAGGKPAVGYVEQQALAELVQWLEAAPFTQPTSTTAMGELRSALADLSESRVDLIEARRYGPEEG